MSLPTYPPVYGSEQNPSWKLMTAPLKVGSSNAWGVYALQAALAVKPLDGVFGPITKQQVEAFQAKQKIVVDGIVGPQTQLTVLGVAEARVHKDFPTLPQGVMKGFAQYEGGSLLAATNFKVPAGSPPGCDCGPMQFHINRMPNGQYLLEDLKKAFAPGQAMKAAAARLLSAMSRLQQKRPTMPYEVVLRAAILNHNAPFLYEQFVDHATLVTPDAIAQWTTKPGGGHYTHGEWFREYTNRILTYTTFA